MLHIMSMLNVFYKNYVCKGEVNAAGAHLKQVFGQEPRDVAAKARWGVVKAWQQNYKVAVNYLSVVAEKDPETLDFLINLMQSAQRKRLAQVITSRVCIDMLSTDKLHCQKKIQYNSLTN